MNSLDFERLLRDGNTQQHFPAEEEKWLLLEKDLERKRRGGVIVLSKKMYWAAAASILLLIAVGFYTLRDVPVDRTKDIVHTSQRRTPAAPPSMLQQGAGKTIITPATISPGSEQSFTSDEVPCSPRRKNEPQPQQVMPSDSGVVSNLPKEEQIDERKPERKAPLLPESKTPLFDNEDKQYAQNDQRRIRLGFSAFYGFSGIAKSQYRVSADARRALSKRVFASVQVVASTALLSTNDRHQYQTVSLGSAGLGPTTSTQETEARYSGSVYNIGLTPSIGFRLTKTISLSAGPDIQKSLTRSVTLVNKDDFRNQINNGTLIDEHQEVVDIDLGLQSAAQVAISRRLSANLMYRYGFTDYLKTASGSSRNSFMCVGLSCSLR